MSLFHKLTHGAFISGKKRVYQDVKKNLSYVKGARNKKSISRKLRKARRKGF